MYVHVYVVRQIAYFLHTDVINMSANIMGI